MQQIPPSNLEAELAILGGILLDNSKMLQTKRRLAPEAFYFPTHRKIYEAFCGLAESQEPIDLITVGLRLENTGHLEGVGGNVFVSSLTDYIPTAANLDHYIEIVLNFYRLRRLIDVAKKMDGAAQAAPNALNLIRGVEQKIYNIGQDCETNKPEHIGPVVERAMDQLESVCQGGKGLMGVSTGYQSLDAFIGALVGSDLNILAGRPSMGKTAFALNLAWKIAVDQKEPVMIFSLETNKTLLASRLICADAGVSVHNWRCGKITDQEWGVITSSAGKLYNAPLYIDDSSDLTPNELIIKAQHVKAKYGLKVVIVDFIQLMVSDLRSVNLRERITDVSRGLRKAAKTLDVCLIVLSQLSRSSENRTDHTPRMADLRESGAIEQDATGIWMLHRPEYYKKDDPEFEGVACLLIEKNKDGPVGNIDFAFVKQFMRFEEDHYPEYCE